MYRDDTCAVCGESLPPDHFYCREHGATVDERLHEIGELVMRIHDDVASLARLMGHVADETWDYLSDQQPDEPLWPPRLPLHVRTDADDVSVDVDSEPGLVRVDMDLPARVGLAAIAESFTDAAWPRFAAAAQEAQGANATH